MADIAEMLYNYNPQGFYEQNRYRSLQADAQNLANYVNTLKADRQKKIWGLQDALAGGDENARAQLAVYDPEGIAKTDQISKAAWQDAGRFARAYNNAPDDMKPAIARQMIGYIGKTYGNSLISDIPPISDTAGFGQFMNGLAQAVDSMDISGGDIYKAQEAEKARQQAFDYDMKKMYAQDALARQRAIEQGTGITSQQKNYNWAIQNGYTPEQAMALAFGGGTNELGASLVDGSLFGKKGSETLSKEQAKNYAEDLNEYNNILSKMPELNDTVARLKELAPVATYTRSGRIRDEIQQERGKPTQGSIARDEYESIIANQILPLLRDTFGAQFTEREGNTLKATLGDPNKSPQSKVKVLDSFINQKTKSLESKYRKLQSYSGGVQNPQNRKTYPEGTVIENGQGVRMIMRNGQWQTM